MCWCILRSLSARILRLRVFRVEGFCRVGNPRSSEAATASQQEGQNKMTRKGRQWRVICSQLLRFCRTQAQNSKNVSENLHDAPRLVLLLSNLNLSGWVPPFFPALLTLSLFLSFSAPTLPSPPRPLGTGQRVEQMCTK